MSPHDFSHDTGEVLYMDVNAVIRSSADFYASAVTKWRQDLVFGSNFYLKEYGGKRFKTDLMNVRSQCKWLSTLEFSKLCDTGRQFCYRNFIHSHSTCKHADAQLSKSHKLTSTSLSPTQDSEATLYVHVSMLNDLFDQ